MSAMMSKASARSGVARRTEAPKAALASSVSAQCVRPVAVRSGASAARVCARVSRAQQAKVVCAAVADAVRPAAQAKVPITNQKPTVVITGASSGLGLNAARALAQQGDWHVVMACRDFGKAESAAKKLGFPAGSYSVMHLDLASMESVRQFAANFKASGRRLDALVCNAAVYLPTAKEPTFTADGYELSVQTNHLSHFLLVQLLLEDLKKAPNGAPRCIIVGSITGNTNTLAGNVPPKANLGDMSGLTNKASMIDAGEFNGAKAYKDSKVCNMLTMRELNKRLHASTGVTFASLYPGCIAETGLFRSHVPLFRTLFPPFQKFVTKGYVSEEEAGRRLAQVVSDPKMNKSGVYWSWNNTSGSFENQVSEEVADDAKATKLYDITMKLVGLA